MAVDYLKDYLGVDPSDYSAMEQGIAGISPVGRSIIPRMGGRRLRRQPIRRPMLSDLPGVPIRRIGRRLQPVQPELGHQPPSLQIVMMFVSVPVRPYAGGALLTRSSLPVLPLEMTQELI